MKSKIKHLFSFVLLVLVFCACDRPVCKNTNPIFDKFSPVSKEYKAELIKQLKTVDKSKITYWFKEYVKSNGEESLLFDIQGDGLCAVIVLNVNQWNKLELLRKNKGVTFRGAEFKNLKFDIKRDSTEIRFLYKDLDKIID
jgi:hypothetical protein